MGNFKDAIQRLSESFEGFAEELRNLAEEATVVAVAGAGEEPWDHENVVQLADRQERQGDIDDETTITMKSGDLRKVLDAYRKMTRYAREGRIPTQDERVELHQHIRKVKHLVRPPRRHAA